MMAHVLNQGRLFGLTPLDWAVLLVGMTGCGALTSLFLSRPSRALRAATGRGGALRRLIRGPFGKRHKSRFNLALPRHAPCRPKNTLGDSLQIAVWSPQKRTP